MILLHAFCKRRAKSTFSFVYAILTPLEGYPFLERASGMPVVSFAIRGQVANANDGLHLLESKIRRGVWVHRIGCVGSGESPDPVLRVASMFWVGPCIVGGGYTVGLVDWGRLLW